MGSTGDTMVPPVEPDMGKQVWIAPAQSSDLLMTCSHWV
jgi:hypothetical protein